MIKIGVIRQSIILSTVQHLWPILPQPTLSELVCVPLEWNAPSQGHSTNSSQMQTTCPYTSTPRAMQRYSAYNYKHVNFARRRNFQSNSHTLVRGELVKKKKEALLGGHGKTRRTVNTSKLPWLNISVCLPRVPHNIIIDKPRSLERNRLVSWRYPQVKQSDELIFLVIVLKENGKQCKTKQNKNKKYDHVSFLLWHHHLPRIQSWRHLR